MAFDLEEKYIIEAENKLKFIFPPSYKRYMMENNGGNIYVEDDDFELFPIKDSSSRKRISRTINDIIYETQEAKTWNNFPINTLVIASNGMGDFLFFRENNISNIYYNEIYLWEHDSKNIKKIANDFFELNIE